MGGAFPVGLVQLATFPAAGGWNPPEGLRGGGGREGPRRGFDRPPAGDVLSLTAEGVALVVAVASNRSSLESAARAEGHRILDPPATGSLAKRAEGGGLLLWRRHNLFCHTGSLNFPPPMQIQISNR